MVLLLLFEIKGEAQIIISDPHALLDKESVNSMYNQALRVAASKRNAQVEFQYCNILYNNNAWYLIPDGHFDVYEWKDGEWFNTYRKDDLGYNFFSTKYLHDDIIYSYGGYGFWRLNAEIISYDHGLGEWAISRDYEHLPQGVCIPGHDLLVIVSGNKLSTLDLTSGGTNSCVVEVVSQFQLRTPVFTLIGKNFSVFLEENLQLLLEKPGNNIYTLKIGSLNKVHQTKKEDCIHIKEDSIFIFGPDFKEKFRESLNANFDQYVPVECAGNKSSISFWKPFALMIFLLGASLTFLIFRRKRSAKNSDQVSMEEAAHVVTPFDKVLSAKGSTLTQDELDLLFDIPDDISPESKRFKRASLITEINVKSKLLYSKELIHRIKDPLDKRKYLYYIES